MSKRALTFLLIFLAGGAAGFLFRAAKEEAMVERVTLRHALPEAGQLVSPLLEYEIPPGGSLELESLRNEVNSYIKEQTSKGKDRHVSFYFMKLKDGVWVGIDEDEGYAAASLLKVPLLIAVLNKAQVFPEILERRITYGSQLDVLSQNIVPARRPELGKTYTVDELLRFMIVYSDNVAKELILDNTDQEYIGRVYSDLGLPAPFEQDKEYMISVKDFAMFFRVLYNATYLNKNMSEKALRLLAETEFPEGIPAGVAPGITVAHKFGERRYLKGETELHDCGIIYHPEGPYLLCVMTVGSDLDQLKKIIRDISGIVNKNKSGSGLRMY
jgi:beta-lactamase class A